MEKVTGIGGFFFLANNPKKLAEWYENHFGITHSTGILRSRTATGLSISGLMEGFFHRDPYGCFDVLKRICHGIFFYIFHSQKSACGRLIWRHSHPFGITTENSFLEKATP